MDAGSELMAGSLCEAAKNGDAREVAWLLGLGLSPDDKLPAGPWSPGRLNMPSENAPGTSALAIAAAGMHPECVELLLRAGADPDAAAEPAKCTAAMFACLQERLDPRQSKRRFECLAALIAAGAKVDARDAEDYTALLCAAYSSSEDCFRALLAAGADVDAVTADGWSSVDMASLNDEPEFKSFILGVMGSAKEKAALDAAANPGSAGRDGGHGAARPRSGRRI